MASLKPLLPLWNNHLTCIYERWVGYIPKSIVTAESQHVHFNVKCQKTMSVGHFLNKKNEIFWMTLEFLHMYKITLITLIFDIIIEILRKYLLYNWTKLNSTKLNSFLPFYQKFKLFKINHSFISQRKLESHKNSSYSSKTFHTRSYIIAKFFQGGHRTKMKMWSDENEKLVGKFSCASGAKKKGFPNFSPVAGFFRRGGTENR